MKHLLQEAYKVSKRMTGITVNTPDGFKQTVSDKNAWGIYTNALSEGLDRDATEQFQVMSENTRIALMENSMFQLNPYESLTMPVLRVFYPKLIAKELVNVMPIDKPDVVKGFIHAKFKKNGDAGFGRNFPDTTGNISQGPDVGVTVTKTALVGTTDILAEAGLTSTNSHIEKNFKIVGLTDSTANTAVVSLGIDVDGNFSHTVTIATQTDVISGHVDFEAGTITFSSANSIVTSIDYEAYASLEENAINPAVRFEVEKIRLTAIDRRISAEWSMNIEQDVKALFDVALQSELVNIIGEQIALDIDNEIINTLISSNAASNPISHTDTFDLNPPTTFTWGRKNWYENIIPTLNELSAQVYNSSLMGAANTIAANPLDAAVLESLNGFEYAGNSVDGGDVGYRSATVAGGKWKILVSSVVPQGKMIVKYRSNDLARAAFCYAPYVPALLSPYPLGNNPSMTILSRYASKMIRPEALAVLNITDTA